MGQKDFRWVVDYHQMEEEVRNGLAEIVLGAHFEVQVGLHFLFEAGLQVELVVLSQTG